MREEIHNIIDPQPNDLMQYRRKAWFETNYGPWSNYIVRYSGTLRSLVHLVLHDTQAQRFAIKRAK